MLAPYHPLTVEGWQARDAMACSDPRRSKVAGSAEAGVLGVQRRAASCGAVGTQLSIFLVGEWR